MPTDCTARPHSGPPTLPTPPSQLCGQACIVSPLRQHVKQQVMHYSISRAQEIAFSTKALSMSGLDPEGGGGGGDGGDYPLF